MRKLAIVLTVATSIADGGIPAGASSKKVTLPLVPEQPGTRHSSGHRKLANPSEKLGKHYEHLIVGSGYGASVTALRLAEHASAHGKPLSLAVLERGKEWLPGDFPESLPKLVGDLRSPINPGGLINTNTNLRAGMDVVGASALGGTSQLNAAITLRPPSNVFTLDAWPAEIRSDFANGLLECYYEIAEAMLRPNSGPNTLGTRKSRAHVANLPRRVPTGTLTLNINHEPDRERFGVTQAACTSCGNCCGGCNVGAKNTLTTNYLPAAKNLGAEIFTQIEVRYVEKLPENTGPARYRVHFTRYHKNVLGIYAREDGTVTARNLFLGAGSAGTTEILMRSQDSQFRMSPTLGTRVSANGDVLGFVYNSEVQTNIAAAKDTKSLIQPEHPVGQAITVYGDFRVLNIHEPIEHQFLLLDGSLPRAVAPDIARIMAATAAPVAFLKSFSGGARAARDLVPGRYPPQNGALNHSMLLLACGHDSCGGRYELDGDGNAYVIWPGMQDEPSFRYIKRMMEEYAQRMGGTFIPNPRSNFFGGDKMQATHPLGGAPMGDSVQTGTVNHFGQVYNADGGMHEGLYVMDAAMIPHSLAAPPLITIAALAERGVRHIISQTSPPRSCESALTDSRAGHSLTNKGADS